MQVKNAGGAEDKRFKGLRYRSLKRRSGKERKVVGDYHDADAPPGAPVKEAEGHKPFKAADEEVEKDERPVEREYQAASDACVRPVRHQNHQGRRAAHARRQARRHPAEPIRALSHVPPPSGPGRALPDGIITGGRRYCSR